MAHYISRSTLAALIRDAQKAGRMTVPLEAVVHAMVIGIHRKYRCVRKSELADFGDHVLYHVEREVLPRIRPDGNAFSYLTTAIIRESHDWNGRPHRSPLRSRRRP